MDAGRGGIEADGFFEPGGTGDRDGSGVVEANEEIQREGQDDEVEEGHAEEEEECIGPMYL